MISLKRFRIFCIAIILRNYRKLIKSILQHPAIDKKNSQTLGLAADTVTLQKLFGTLLLWMLKQLLRCTLLSDNPLVHKYDTGADIMGKMHFMGNDDHGQTLTGQILHDIQNITDHFWI